MHPILEMLAERKEQILFLCCLLLCAQVVLSSPLFVTGIEDLDREARVQAMKQTGLDSDRAQNAERQFKSPDPIKPQPIEEAQVNKGYFNEKDVFDKPRVSTFSRTRDELKPLPPLALDFPGFIELAEFDLPAGPLPDSGRILGYVPRDARPVLLTKPDDSEFKDK